MELGYVKVIYASNNLRLCDKYGRHKNDVIELPVISKFVFGTFSLTNPPLPRVILPEDTHLIRVDHIGEPAPLHGLIPAVLVQRWCSDVKRVHILTTRAYNIKCPESKNMLRPHYGSLSFDIWHSGPRFRCHLPHLPIIRLPQSSLSPWTSTIPYHWEHARYPPSVPGDSIYKVS